MLSQGETRTTEGRSQPLHWTRRTPDAFSEVLDDARRGMFDQPAGRSLVRLLTLAGRVRYDDALDGLTAWERAVLTEALPHEDLRLTSLDAPPGDRGEAVVVSQSDFGRLQLYADDEEPDGTCLARLVLPPAAAERAREAAEEAELVESVEREPLERLLADAERSGRLGEIVREVADRVDHVESVYVYVGRRLFARSDVGNTLLRGGKLLALADQPLHSWPPEARVFVAGFDLLFRTGRSIRIEEFNGRQLSAGAVRAWLERKHRLYAARLGLPCEPAEDLIALADRVRELRPRLEPGGAFGYRRVNGVALAKREIVGTIADFDPEPHALGPLLAGLAAANDVPVDTDPTVTVRSLARSALEAKAEDPESTMVETLLERIVLSAVWHAGADYGMSSSIRALSRLRPANGQRCAGVLEVAKPDFFCVSVPHPELVGKLDEETMAEVLMAVASRMQFNRWHFLPGNFERDEVPAKRHYFFPPLMPDVAEWSDLRHPGHTNSSVRYTVRAPGPALWRPPLRVFGNEYRGFFDIRLVRMAGPPFTMREVRVACQHCAFMDTFWREAAAVVEETASPSPVVSGFALDYWSERAWGPAVAEAASLDGESPLMVGELLKSGT